MPGFLSDYTQITTVEFADGAYWAKVRRFLRRGDFKAAQLALVQPVMRYVGGEDDAQGNETTKAETSGNIDTGAYQDELVCRALMEWNFTDEDGNSIPLGGVDPTKGPDATRRAAIAVLPQEVFDKLLLAIEGASVKKKKKDGEAADPFRQGRETSLVLSEVGAS